MVPLKFVELDAVISLAQTSILLGIAAYFTIKLRNFVKAKKETETVQGSGLIPWQMAGNQENQYSMRIPENMIRLCIGYALVPVILLCFIPWNELRDESYDEMSDDSLTEVFDAELAVINLFTIVMATYPPVLTAFAIKHQNTSVGIIINAQPPKGLQFHNENQENEPIENELPQGENERYVSFAELLNETEDGKDVLKQGIPMKNLFEMNKSGLVEVQI